jgi:hypothetical protein
MDSFVFKGANMGILAAAFACAWISVAMYVGWLGMQHRRLVVQLRGMRPETADRCDRQSSSTRPA